MKLPKYQGVVFALRSVVMDLTSANSSVTIIILLMVMAVQVSARSNLDTPVLVAAH
jgi:hypothetical protein